MEEYELPLFPLRAVLFPGQTLPLHIFEPRYRQMIADCLASDRTFGVVLIREGAEVGGPATPCEVGTTAIIQDVERLDDGRMNIVTVGHERFRLQAYDDGARPYLVGRVITYPWQEQDRVEQSLVRAVQRRLERYVDLFAQASDSDFYVDLSFQHPSALAALAAVILQITPQQKQSLLEIPSVDELLHNMAQLLVQENRALQIALASSHLQAKMHNSFSLN